MPPLIDSEKCVKCGYCAEICPLDVIQIEYVNPSEKNIVVAYPDECWHCKACQNDCPKDAITMRYPLSHFMLHYKIK